MFDHLKWEGKVNYIWELLRDQWACKWIYGELSQKNEIKPTTLPMKSLHILDFNGSKNRLNEHVFVFCDKISIYLLFEKKNPQKQNISPVW